MMTNKVEHNKVFTFDLENTLSFGNLESETLLEVLSDGRVSSHFLERQLPLWFPELQHVAGCKDHDHINKKSGLKYDQKCFTKRGCRFAPSSMIGTGRKFDKEKFFEKAQSMIYIVCDITKLPQIQVIFREGSALAEEYSKGTIPLRDRDKFFMSIEKSVKHDEQEAQEEA